MLSVLLQLRLDAMAKRRRFSAQVIPADDDAAPRDAVLLLLFLLLEEEEEGEGEVPDFLLAAASLRVSKT